MAKKKSSSRSSQYIGQSTFIDGKPVCKPVVPGRRPKPLEGPVHPGFKGKPKKKVRKSVPRPTIVRSDQNNDLYKPAKKSIFSRWSKNK